MFAILIGLWWVAVVLSTMMVASLVAIVVGVVVVTIRRALSARAASADPKRTARVLARPVVRRVILPVWGAAFVAWLALECLGAAFLVWAAASRPAPLPVDLPRAAPGTLRVVAIGGSTARGAPYHASLSFAHVVGWRLATVFPDTRILVENLAYGGATIEDMYRALGRLETRPDVLLVYTGHNEFLRYPPDREAGTPYYGVRHFSLLAQALAGQIERRGAHEGPAWQGRRRLLDRPVCTAHEAATVHRRFRRMLTAILGTWQRAGTLAVVFLPIANEAGFAPNRSVLPAGTPTQTRARLERIYEQLARPGIRREVEGRLLHEARDLAPGFALTWFRLGRWYETAGETARARQHYQRAIDRDGFPIRATSRIRRTIRRAGRATGAVLLDARHAVAPLGRDVLLGNDVIHDNCHPNLRVHVALASMVLRTLRDRHVPERWPGTAADTAAFEAGVAATAAQFGIDAGAWVRICENQAAFFQYLSVYTHDGHSRLQRLRAYQAAADRIRRGTPPPRAGIPAMSSPADWQMRITPEPSPPGR
jgi:hypothetical protein